MGDLRTIEGVQYEEIGGSLVPVGDLADEGNGHRGPDDVDVVETAIENPSTFVAIESGQGGQGDTDPFSDPEKEVPAPTDPRAVAKAWVKAFHSNELDENLIVHHRNTFYVYDGTSWPEYEDRRLESDLYGWLEDKWYWKDTTEKPKQVRFEPNARKLGDIIHALRGLVHVDASVTPPCWLDGEGPEVIPMANGLLELDGRVLHAHTPRFLSHHVLPFDYDDRAPYPSRWLTFLEELWPDELESRDALAEIMGYIIGGGTEQQKLFMLIGPPRAGKGVIGRVLSRLLGPNNVAAPTMSGLTSHFGLWPLIGKPLALISDARLGSRADTPTAVERLLSISGEDSLTIDRKYRDLWTGRLTSRFVILTNELPRFVDASGALASRFVVLVLTTSFLGRENPMLTEELYEEAPGILNWALDGLDRLRARGHFEQPPSALEAIQHLHDLTAPVSAFIRDCCELGPEYSILKDDLYADWKEWCSTEGMDRTTTKAVFVRDLRAAFPGIYPSRPLQGGKKVHMLKGISRRGLQ